MPSFLIDRAIDIARGVKAVLKPENSATPGTASDAGRQEADRTEDPKNTRRRASEYAERLKSKKRELSRVQKQLRAAEERAEIVKNRRNRKRIQQDIFRLEMELRAAKGGAQDEARMGALPDFVIIGARKAGTTFLYNLLTRHPHVEPAAAKELHYFDHLFKEEGPEWYRGCFPQPRSKAGRMTITGEATPYLAHTLAPERMAGVAPEARLIALLRNPIDRAYSDYQHVVKKGWETQTFEEAVGLEEATLETESSRTSSDKGSEVSEDGPHIGLEDPRRYLYRGIYVDQLVRWSRFFDREQMLVLKSEDLFGRTPEALELILDFLDLPDWDPEARRETLKKRNVGAYKQKMDPATRRQLERYFEPHNRRLYEYLGTDLGW